MLACSEGNVGRNLVVVVVVLLALLGSRNADDIGKGLAIERKLETGGRTGSSHGSEHGVVARFLHVDRVFEPVAFAVVAHDDAGSLLVEVDTRRVLAVFLHVAVVFDIAFAVRDVAYAISFADTGNIEVFGLNLARNLECGALEHLARHRFDRSEHASLEAGSVHALVGSQIFLHPCESRTILTIPDKTRATVRLTITVKPGLTVDPSPNGDTGNMGVFHPVLDLFLIALLLDAIVGRRNVIFRDENREIISFLMDLLHGRNEIIVIHANAAAASTASLTTVTHQVMSLEAVSINGSAILPDGVDQVNTLVHMPLDGVIVVIDEDSLGPTFASHLERGRQEGVIAVVIATQCRNNLGSGITRMILIVASTDSLVGHVDHLDIGVMCLDGIEPSGNSLLGFVNAQAFEPARILAAPKEGVELKVTAIILCPVVGCVATAPVVATASTFDGAPLTTVFGGSLVPQLGKLVVGTRRSVRLSNVANELCCAIGNAGTRKGERGRRKSDCSNLRCR